MDFKELMHNPLLMTSTCTVVALIVGWALPNDKLYKMVRPLFIALKVRFGKMLMKTVAEKIDVIDKAAEDVANEEQKK
jgi:hypothetical protein